MEQPEKSRTNEIGRSVYAYATPVILLVGFLGNSLSLTVFLSRNMRNLSASSYLAALSVSDLLVLIFYVTVEWLKRGLVYLLPEFKLHFLDQNGTCQTLLYIAYVLRFLSSWLVTAFTIERYIGVCHPLYRRYICSLPGSRRIIFGVMIASCIIVIYKPVLSGVYLSHDGIHYCTGSKDHDFLSFVLDSIFALLITLVPFVIISVLNVLIMRKLCLRKSHRENRSKISSQSSSDASFIRLEFTLILFTISFCFITFNGPYFIVWFRNFLHSKHLSKHLQYSNYGVEYWQGILYITKTIFYMNYCINFFLYSITGRHFRREVKSLLTFKHKMTSSRFSRSASKNCSWV
ncbi:neurotensin receptor type 1-like [Mytilus californianus]|uniref:neurotensin receptor type 1-like n=1 Tax=Mytilus californianus TaxID=6549 RepID=UPI002247EF65|nr:neurotensin receptor type 1-like [Mytilus californianus]